MTDESQSRNQSSTPGDALTDVGSVAPGAFAPISAPNLNGGDDTGELSFALLNTTGTTQLPATLPAGDTVSSSLSAPSGDLLPSPNNLPGYAKWLSTVNFPPYFPALMPIVHPVYRSGELGSVNAPGEVLHRAMFFESEHQERVENIYESLLAPHFATLVEPGHGATTLCRYMYWTSFSSSVALRRIPVQISLEDYLDYSQIHARVGGQIPPTFSYSRRRRIYYFAMLAEADRIQRMSGRAKKREAETIAEVAFRPIIENADQIVDEAIREGVVTCLLSGRWERPLRRSYYGALIGAHGQSEEEIDRRRENLRSFLLPSPNWSVLEREAPQLCRPTQDLLADLSTRMGVRVSLQLDLSSTPIGRFNVDDKTGSRLGREQPTTAFNDAVSAVMQALKNLDSSEAQVLPSLLNQALFLSPESLERMKTVWQIVPEQERFPFYKPADVYAMVAYHFRPIEEPGRRRRDAISAVIPSSLLNGISSRQQGLSSTMLALRNKLSDANPNPELVNYQIEDPKSRASSDGTPDSGAT